MICFKYGRQGHKEDNCPMHQNVSEPRIEELSEHTAQQEITELQKKPEEEATYGC